jgi:pimeloyl-ACP methyl ester carboxylesterase
MGGMLALELARRRSCRGVILIASSRDARLVPPLLKWMAGFLRVAPDLGRRARLPAWRSLVRRLGCLSPADQDILAQALSSFPLDHIREYARMVVEWKGVPEAGVPTTHVHGDRDLVIPIRYVRPDAIVKGGGHALNMTHPEAVN